MAIIRTKKTATATVVLLLIATLLYCCISTTHVVVHAFTTTGQKYQTTTQKQQRLMTRRFLNSQEENNGNDEPAPDDDDEQILRLKNELLILALKTDRGFKASRERRQEAVQIIDSLAALNPTAEPASPYYEDQTYIPGPNMSGKWTLVYTDAPDITSLASSSPTAKLGRIGQECNPPYIKNVIEWKRPDWAEALPFSGTRESRILQKVCTKATASPNDPLQLNLDLAGIELVTADDEQEESSFWDAIQNDGLPVGLLKQAPVVLEGPATVPFGKARILYLDDQMRILRTQQNFVAVNVRSEPDWF
jgi:hypothetical protein